MDEINEACLTVDTKLGEYAETVKVFPNPAGDWLTLKMPEGLNEGALYIYNIAGEILYNRDFAGKEQVINLTNIPSGIYIMKVIASNCNFNLKFVKL